MWATLLLFGTVSLLVIAAPPGGYRGRRAALEGQGFTKIHRVKRSSDGSIEVNLLIVTDLDKASRTGKDTYLWRAVTRKGKLWINKSRNDARITWEKNSDRNLTSTLNAKGRAMELSDLSRYNNRLLTPDDRTGMIYEIKDDKAIAWVYLATGNGQVAEAFKAEWMTVKDGLLYVGSHGNEFIDTSGKVVHENNMWVKTVDANGAVKHHDWRQIYDRMRKSVGINKPGYLTHEAAQWSPTRNRWFFLPRKESKTQYVEVEDEKKGTNLLLMGHPDLSRFSPIRIGKLHNPERGYSAFDFVPGTNDQIIVAIKSKEVGGEAVESYINVFDTSGNVILDDQKLEGEYKFEGLFFV